MNTLTRFLLGCELFKSVEYHFTFETFTSFTREPWVLRCQTNNLILWNISMMIDTCTYINSSFKCGNSPFVTRYFIDIPPKTQMQRFYKYFRNIFYTFDQVKLMLGKKRYLFNKRKIERDIDASIHFNCFTSNISSSIKWLHHLKWHNLYWCQQIRSFIRLNPIKLPETARVCVLW